MTATLAACTVAQTLAGEQWPQFRGPQSGVVADSPDLPETWGPSENVVWQTTIPGYGWSSPVVWGEHVFVTATVSAGTEPAPVRGLYDPGNDHGKMRSTASQRWVVYDVDFETGRIRWTRELRNTPAPVMRHIKNSFASETPVTDGEHVYVYFGSLGAVAALDLAGNISWVKEVAALDGRQGFGTAASPLLYRGRLYVVHDNLTRSFMVAFDAKSGTELWRVDREEVENWSTPVVWENALRTEIVTSGMGKVRSYDLDGKLLWQVGGMTVNTVPTPIPTRDLIYINSGYPGANPRPVYAIKPGASGDISLKSGETSNEFIRWYQPLLGTYNTSSLVYGDFYYTLLDRGFLLCHNARTGEQVYGRQRISAESSGFTASPWAYNGKLFLLSEDGDTFVIQAGPEYKLLGKNSLNEMTLATPAVARGSLILRTQTKLYRIAKAVRP
jgi:outer membrane protein assembly factor BamB